MSWLSTAITLCWESIVVVLQIKDYWPGSPKMYVCESYIKLHNGPSSGESDNCFRDIF